MVSHIDVFIQNGIVTVSFYPIVLYERSQIDQSLIGCIKLPLYFRVAGVTIAKPSKQC